MTETTPDYAGLSRRLGALAYHILQTGTADGQDAQTCFEVAEALRTLLASKEELERERDELKHDVSRYIEIASDEATRAEAAEAKLAEARKALEPFALVAEHDISEDEADSDPFHPMPKPLNRAPQITVGHLRAARRALGGENG